jgi:hypothetical protein
MELADIGDFNMGVPYENYRIYGPYKRKDGRKHIIAISSCGNRFTVSYPKYLMELHIGRYLIKGESVDHIDCNFDNNTLSNLRILGLSEHVKLDVLRLKPVTFECPVCKNKFMLHGRQVHDAYNNRQKGRTGPFCSKHCAGLGSPKISPVIKDYYTLKSLNQETD